MSLIHLAVKHGGTLEQARAQLESTIADVQGKFGPLVQRVEWSADRNSARLFAAGCEVAMRVDPLEVHLDADLPLLGKLLGSPLVAGLKSIVQQRFHKQLEQKP